MSKNQGKDSLVFFASILSKMSQMFSEINSMYLQAMVNKKSSDLAPEFNVNQLFSDFEKEEKNKVADLEDLDEILLSENESKHEEVRQSPKKTKKEVKRNKKEQQQSIKKAKEPTIQPPHPPPSSYLIFFNEHRSKITEEFPNLNITEQSKVASKCWRELTEEQKKPYHDRFNEEKQKYYQELKIYNEMKGSEEASKKKPANKPKVPKNEKKNQAANKDENPKDRLIPKQSPRQQNQQSSELSSSITI